MEGVVKLGTEARGFGEINHAHTHSVGVVGGRENEGKGILVKRELGLSRGRPRVGGLLVYEYLRELRLQCKRGHVETSAHERVPGLNAGLVSHDAVISNGHSLLDGCGRQGAVCLDLLAIDHGPRGRCVARLDLGVCGVYRCSDLEDLGGGLHVRSRTGFTHAGKFVARSLWHVNRSRGEHRTVGYIEELLSVVLDAVHCLCNPRKETELYASRLDHSGVVILERQVALEGACHRGVLFYLGGRDQGGKTTAVNITKLLDVPIAKFHLGVGNTLRRDLGRRRGGIQQRRAFLGELSLGKAFLGIRISGTSGCTGGKMELAHF
ncbi:hypothetical protein ATCV1_z656R [Acanthocystis turfacea chlorella virus 1]|uniref:Uncharacterized protein z656R n=1 Tax=Chlorovirus heliozoae TaxID=322019 RepID=A7K9R6_9PHYC|nr:hypothetical protein ATCV1_z656R [Acanthocystis turfacea chlorella virus 1]ABT16790.1 hypothetical protein ATCV1_z656R [Acanthocystis turfacea chlorella virus 1]